MACSERPPGRTTVERYVARANQLDLGGLDLLHVGPLGADVRRCLCDMHDAETHTMCFLRDLLLTSAHRDPEMTAFLTMWAYEEFWHGAAIGLLRIDRGIECLSGLGRLRLAESTVESVGS